MRALIIAGGTLGHIKPSLEIAEVLKKQKDEVIFVTTSKQKGYIENKGFKTYTINAPYTKRLASFNTIKFPLKFINSYINSKRLLRKINPDVIISLGSYLSIPIILNSKKRIPLFLCEQNVFPFQFIIMVILWVKNSSKGKKQKTEILLSLFLGEQMVPMISIES